MAEHIPMIDRLVEVIGGGSDRDGIYVMEVEAMKARNEIGVSFTDGSSCVLKVVHVDD